jgi:hypothetical protein
VKAKAKVEVEVEVSTAARGEGRGNTTEANTAATMAMVLRDATNTEGIGRTREVAAGTSEGDRISKESPGRRLRRTRVVRAYLTKVPPQGSS